MNEAPLNLWIRRQSSLGDEFLSQNARDSLFSAADLYLLGIGGNIPVNGEAELLEHRVERGKVAVLLGIGHDAVTVKNERGHYEVALPAEPNSTASAVTSSMTSARVAEKSVGGSHLVRVSAVLR